MSVKIFTRISKKSFAFFETNVILDINVFFDINIFPDINVFLRKHILSKFFELQITDINFLRATISFDINMFLMHYFHQNICVKNNPFVVRKDNTATKR